MRKEEGVKPTTNIEYSKLMKWIDYLYYDLFDYLKLHVEFYSVRSYFTSRIFPLPLIQVGGGAST